MKEKLIEILGLTPIAPATEVTEETIVAAVIELNRAAAKIADGNKLEKQITELVASSAGALNREQAINVIRDRANNAKK